MNKRTFAYVVVPLNAALGVTNAFFGVTTHNLASWLVAVLCFGTCLLWVPSLKAE